MMTPLEIVLIGILGVFVTLGILTIATYGMIEVVKRYKDREESDKKKIAAIVVKAKTQRGSKCSN